MKKSFPELRTAVLNSSQDERSKHILAMSERLATPFAQNVDVIEKEKPKRLIVTRNGAGPLVTPHGDLWMYSFSVSDGWVKYSALVRCAGIDPETLNPIFAHKEKMTVRIDSGCETGQLFLDGTCECREQLHDTMKQIVGCGEGIIVHIPSQDGRGKGMPFKLSTLYLQKELGLDTVQSAACMAGDDDIDVRTYSGVIAVLKCFGLQPGETAINLATNNPDKMRVFTENGFTVDNTPVVIPPTELTRAHLEAKKLQLNHKYE